VTMVAIACATLMSRGATAEAEANAAARHPTRPSIRKTAMRTLATCWLEAGRAEEAATR